MKASGPYGALAVNLNLGGFMTWYHPKKFSIAYQDWCEKHGLQPGTEAIKQFHLSPECPKHDLCNFCPGSKETQGAMAA